MARSRAPGARGSGAPGDITAGLRAGAGGDEEAMAAALSELYATLRRLAARALAGERANHTLETSGLIAEAYFRLVEQRRIRWSNREHFVATAAQMMRRILVDYARGRATAKRGGAVRIVTLDDVAPLGPRTLDSIVAIHEALEALQRELPDSSAVVELRFFGGLSNDEIAAHLRTSVATVERRWRLARAWLYRRLAAATP